MNHDAKQKQMKPSTHAARKKEENNSQSTYAQQTKTKTYTVGTILLFELVEYSTSGAR
jgi:hypothetical protein